MRRLLVLTVVVALVGGLGPRRGHGQSEATVRAGTDGFRVVSADEAFALRLRADLYVDARAFPGTAVAPGAERLFLRRARPRLQGRLYDRFTFSLRPDFGVGGPEIDDAYLGVRFAPGLRVRAGRFKVPVGLEVLQSSTGLMHVERGFPTQLVPGRDVGAAVGGRGAWGRYAIGVFNGAPGPTEPGVEVDNAKEGAARLFVTPFGSSEGPLKNLGIGVAGTTGRVTGTDAGLLTLRTTGRRPFFRYRQSVRASGTRWRVAPQARLFAGPVELLAEYTVLHETVRRGPAERALRHRAWQASAAVVLTGEDARDGEVVPRDPFAAERGLGAFELGARLHGVALDAAAFPTFADPATAASGARAWALTLSWYPNALTRLMLGVERTTFDAAGSAVAQGAENLLLARMQVAF